MTSQPGQQAIIIHILWKISQNKHSETIKFGQAIEYNKNIFFKNHAENEAANLFLFFLKSLISAKSKWSAAQFRCISITLFFAYNKNKLYETL